MGALRTRRTMLLRPATTTWATTSTRRCSSTVLPQRIHTLQHNKRASEYLTGMAGMDRAVTRRPLLRCRAGGRGGFGRVWANASHFDDLWKFDIPTRTWTKLEPAGPKPLARWLHTSTGYAYHHVRGRSLCCAARCPHTAASMHWHIRPCFFVLHPTWSMSAVTNQHGDVALLASQVERIQPAVAENNMFVVSGGEDLRRCYMNDVWAYDVRANTWDAIQECTFCQNSCKLDARGNAAPLSAAATA